MSNNFKYTDLMNDEVFKLVFGQESSKEVMIEFLNQVITDRQITDLEYFDKEMHPSERGNKGSIFDMCCRTNDGSRIIVEVQRRKQPFFPERAIYYSTFQIQRQVAAGAKEYDFLPVYVVNIMEFDLDRNEGFTDVRTVYRLYEEKSHRLLTDRVTLIFIELNKFKKSIDELDGNILEGMYFCFKNMINLSQRPDVLDHNVFKKIFEVSELYNMDEETRKKVLEQMTTERDLRNQMACATEEGRAIGLAEGLAEGRAEGKEKAKEALKLIAKGASVKDAAEFLGISEAELE